MCMYHMYSNTYYKILHKFCLPQIARYRLLHIIQLLWLHVSPENITLEEVRDLPQTIRSVDVCWHAEDLIQFLECLALRFLEAS